MFRMLKRLFYLALFIALALVLWFGFALWSGLYAIYSNPPSREFPDGRTLVVEREQAEPMFDSPGYRPPPPPPRSKERSGLSLGPAQRAGKPVEKRTIVALPYIPWAYEKSLEPPEPEPAKE